MKNEDKYTIIYFKDDREMLIKGFDEADEYAIEHENEILFTYTDHTGKEHLEKRFMSM